MQNSNSGVETEQVDEKRSFEESESSTGSVKSKGIVKNSGFRGPGSTWSDQEELALLEALKTHKWGDWEAIQLEIKTKTVPQLKSKITNLQVHKLGSKSSQVRKDILELILKVTEQEYIETCI